MSSLRLMAATLVVFIGLILSGYKNQPCQTYYRDDLTIYTHTSTVRVEAARTPQAKLKGLGGRECIGPNQGMMFAFSRAATYPFWMKDMRFPIDIIWISANHRVVQVQPNISPNTYPHSFQNQQPAQYVLELRAGRAAQLGMRIGSSLQFVNP